MQLQYLSSASGCRQQSRLAARQQAHYAYKHYLLGRTLHSSLLRSNNQGPGCSTLPHRDHAGDEDCQWPEPVGDDQQQDRPASSNGNGTSSNGVLQQQQVQDTSSSTSCCSDAPNLPLLSTSSSELATCDSVSSSVSSSDSSSPQQPPQQPWPPDVPWGLNKIAQVMGLWLLAYFATGQLVVPAALAVFDLDQAYLSARGAAVLNLVLDILQVGVTVGILARCLRKYEPMRRNLFPLSWQQGQWLGYVAAGATVFPVVDWLVQSLTQSGVEALQAPPDMWTAQIEAGLYNQDWLSCTAYTLVVVVVAPIWEEVIFRGFVLRTLMKPLSLPAALPCSALIFALCHFNTDTFAPLVLLGVVFGWLYAKCNNLLPCMILHSLWNAYVLGALILRIHTGCDAVTCSVVMAVGTQVVMLLCGLVLMQLQQHRKQTKQQQVAGSPSVT